MKENISEFIYIGIFLILFIGAVVWTLRKTQEQKQKALKSLDDVPFDSVSTDDKNFELSNLYQSQKERIQRGLDG